MSRLAGLTAVVAWVIVGCGSSEPLAVAPTSPPPSAAPTAPAADDDDRPSSGAAPKAAEAAVKSAEAPMGDGKPRPLELLSMAGAFPAKTAGDDVCFSEVGLSGRYDKDYGALTSACGAPTGMREFTKKVSGKLDASHKIDTWVFAMKGGWCYRFFLVADESLDKLNLFIKRPTGALVSMHDANQPVLMVDPKGVWCKTHDREFHLEIGLRGEAHGQYSFGIWARPKPK